MRFSPAARTALFLVLASSPVAAQVRLGALPWRGGMGVASAPLVLSGPGLSLGAPSLGAKPTLTPILMPAVPLLSAAPIPSAQVQPAAAAQANAELSRIDAGLSAVTGGLARLAAPGAGDVREAGDQVEDLLTGRSRPALPAEVAVPAGPAAAPSSEELAFTARAAADLAAVAEDVGAERGLKASRMTGRDFIGMVETGAQRFAQSQADQAPSPRAFAAARSVQSSLLRIVKAMLKPEQPLLPQITRLLSVWQVFSQTMDETSGQGSLDAIEAEAALFASQVEQSV